MGVLDFFPLFASGESLEVAIEIKIGVCCYGVRYEDRCVLMEVEGYRIRV